MTAQLIDDLIFFYFITDVITSKEVDAEGQEVKQKYPYSIFFIISNEFCERFNYYGMRTILAIYLTRQLLFSDDIATIIYHSFTTLVYFCCILGGLCFIFLIKYSFKCNILILKQLLRTVFGANSILSYGFPWCM